ncbi:protein fem-1 homolog C-like [Mytilus trossulus]|uniref:protein fem-1 homolog C-like n=1 Tax=Mytilus trossulus TaxID=6551 RepID=UPI003005781C
MACHDGHYETVKFLLDLNCQVLNSRVDTTIKNIFGESGLHLVSKNGHIEVVKLFVDVGMNLNDTTNAGYTPLYQACRKGRFDIVKYLLDVNGKTLNSRVDTLIKGTNGWSALHTACFNGHAGILKLLICVGMDINERDHSGKTAVHLARINGHGDIVKKLKDNCAELKTYDSDKRTSLMRAKGNGCLIL